MTTAEESTLDKLRDELAQAKKQINSLRISVRAEEMKVKISSEYTNFGLWEYDIAEDIMYQYKKLHGRYEKNLDPIIRFRTTVISWGTVNVEDLPVFNKFCDALERGDREMNCDVRVLNDSCEMVWFRYEGKTVFDEDGRPLRVIGRTLDVTAEKGGTDIKADDRHDPLTGVYRYDAFRELVGRLTSGEDIYKSSALILVGVHGTSELSEKNRHNVMKTVGKLLNGISACYHESIVGLTDSEEFGFFVRFTDIPSLEGVARQICDTINGLDRAVNEEYSRVSVSSGIAIIKGGKRFDTVYAEARTALFSAKRSTGGSALYNSSMAALARVPRPVSKPEEAKFSDDTAEILGLAVSALVDRPHAPDFMGRAFTLAGSRIGAQSIVFMIAQEDGFRREVVYSCGEKTGSRCPRVDFNGSVAEALHRLYELNGPLLVDGSSHGFETAGGAESALVFPVRTNSGIKGYLSVTSTGGAELDGENRRVLVMLVDVLDRLYTVFEDELVAGERQRYEKTALDILRVESYTIDPHSYIVDYAGENTQAHLGLKAGDVCYEKLFGRKSPCHDCPLKELEAGKLQATSVFFRPEEHRWFSRTAFIDEAADGKKHCCICCADITACLGKINTHDMLTGVMTLDTFTSEAMRLVSDCRHGYSTTVLNVAGFRRLNESAGYEAGNAILIAISDILERSVVKGELLCRSEGSRFILLLRSKSHSELEVRLNQLLASIQKQVYEKCCRQIYLLAGVYEMTSESVGIMGALDRAITAQKTVKDKSYYNDNLIAAYDKQLRAEIQSRQYIEAHMVEALENDEFHVYYQPKVCLATGKITGAEALVRWIKSDGEIIPPSKFVPIFEENGFISDMDFAIYRQAVADIKRWLRSGIEVPLISLNVSRHHLKDEHFSEKLTTLVDSIGVPHDKIEFEITESLLTENMETLVDTMTQLKNAGFHISIDDFGSGYSSLNLITLLPFDTLKIDGGFFLKNDLTDRNKKVISSVITLAKSLNLETVSEGVETQVQVDFLKSLGCDMIQGFFYYRPMPSGDFTKLIEKKA